MAFLLTIDSTVISPFDSLAECWEQINRALVADPLPRGRGTRIKIEDLGGSGWFWSGAMNSRDWKLCAKDQQMFELFMKLQGWE
ncbi:hypothetical protein VSR34_30300 [Paraburkholderia sp. JHI2823]|uniref:hypothetical protein n=1 Tax=Paraburkholderia sp. JHI2823 TaxID=3112960 RepID=UPI00316ECB4D